MIPSTTSSSSSVRLSQNKRFGAKIANSRYARKKRRAKIAAGLMPHASTIFVETNVVPKSTTTTMASM
ncbi:MAG: hypothetical protein HUK08_02725 [Bacteroidaceae bacterium]|nr:hypothetical protein [Bacteroidaceae bacterium]